MGEWAHKTIFAFGVMVVIVVVVVVTVVPVGGSRVVADGRRGVPRIDRGVACCYYYYRHHHHHGGNGHPRQLAFCNRPTLLESCAEHRDGCEFPTNGTAAAVAVVASLVVVVVVLVPLPPSCTPIHSTANVCRRGRHS